MVARENGPLELGDDRVFVTVDPLEYSLPILPARKEILAHFLLNAPGAITTGFQFAHRLYLFHALYFHFFFLFLS
ncbi:MAG: Uncharacterised protein [Flavobacteriia bacterium]|nr:MAG: Uncharacterised protein [Flavobacteriia bacterium]